MEEPGRLQFDALEKEMAAHSSILAWRIPWTEEPGRLQCTRGLGAISQILSGGSPESRRSLGMGAGTPILGGFLAWQAVG